MSRTLTKSEEAAEWIVIVKTGGLFLEDKIYE